MNGLKSTSMIFSGVTQVVDDPYACFCAEDGHGCHLELYPRQNGESMNALMCMPPSVSLCMCHVGVPVLVSFRIILNIYNSHFGNLLY